MSLLSPLRYPGGKARIAPFLADIIDLNDLRGGTYFEPYAGGAGAALALLDSAAVSEIYINDIDPRIHAFWKAALDEPDRFIDAIFNAELSLEEWKRQRQICEQPSAFSPFELGFSAFYMNRCNRSGIIVGAGPIGGFQQKGKWKLDVRFNRERLAERILEIQKLRTSIHLSSSDAIDFLKQYLPRGNKRSEAFAYLDPPYVAKGGRLYYNVYNSSDHRAVANYVRKQKNLHWVMSYDLHPLIREIYHDQCVNGLPVLYSLQKKRTDRELIITPTQLSLPVGIREHAA